MSDGKPIQTDSVSLWPALNKPFTSLNQFSKSGSTRKRTQRPTAWIHLFKCLVMRQVFNQWLRCSYLWTWWGWKWVSLAVWGKKDYCLAVVKDTGSDRWFDGMQELSRGIMRSWHGDASIPRHEHQLRFPESFSWWVAIHNEMSARHAETCENTRVSKGGKKRDELSIVSIAVV